MGSFGEGFQERIGGVYDGRVFVAPSLVRVGADDGGAIGCLHFGCRDRGLGFNPRISQASFGVAVLRLKIAPQVAGKEAFFPCFFGLGGVTVLGGRVARVVFPVARSIPHCLHHSERFFPM